jgi:O-antigen/teichoic acid export membrane protein
MTRVITVAVSIALARVLDVESFGKFGMLQSTLLTLQAFANVGLSQTATKYVAEFRTTDPARAGRVVGLSNTTALIAGTLLLLLTALTAPWLSHRALAAADLQGSLKITSVAVLFGALAGAQVGALAGLQAFRTMAGAGALSALLSSPALLVGALYGGVTGAAWGLVLTSVATWAVGHVALRKELRRAQIAVTRLGSRRELPFLLSFSVPAMLSGTMVMPVFWYCATRFAQQPNGYKEIGVFNAANQWFAALLVVPVLVGQVVLPEMASRLGRNQENDATRVLWTAMKANGIFASVTGLCLAVLSPLIMSSYGSEFRSGWPALVVSIVTAVLIAVQAPIGQFIAASGRMWTGFAMNLGWAIVFILLSLAWASDGALGFAGARLAAYSAHAVWTFGFAYVLLTRRKGL